VTFEVIPAIDIRGGRCVRLFQGDYSRQTVYDGRPDEVAAHWQELGAKRLHVVDLDGARSGEQVNAPTVLSILATVSIPVELGGGTRDLQTIDRWVEAGLDRVYLGTAAVANPDLVIEACRRFPGRIAAAADARDRRIAVSGWEEGSDLEVVDFTRDMLAAGVSAVNYTNVSLDGTFSGPDVEGVQRLIEALGPHDAQILLAGGVGSLDDVKRAAGVQGLDGLIIGRALYEGRVDLTEALAAAAETPR
jgi:phosphoribosylformimino-5-aminoimidazole carboxamide ribotide isomerase